MIFHFDKNYSRKDQDLFESAQEEDLSQICLYLLTDKDLLGKVKFEVFSTREGKQDADPNHSISRASARFNEMAIYRYWIPADDPHFPHEITHLVAHTWSKPYLLETELDTWDNKKIKKTIEMVSTSFMQEGLAIAVDDIIFKRKLMEKGEHKFIDDWCRKQVDKMPTLSECINMDGFGNFENNILLRLKSEVSSLRKNVYSCSIHPRNKLRGILEQSNKIVVPFTASFSKYLLITFGLAKYKKMYVQLKETNISKQNLNIIESVYLKSETQLLLEWREFLYTS